MSTAAAIIAAADARRRALEREVASVWSDAAFRSLQGRSLTPLDVAATRLAREADALEDQLKAARSLLKDG